MTIDPQRDFPGAALRERYPDGTVRSLSVSGPLELRTPYGLLVPQHGAEDPRRPKIDPVEFHPTGALKSVPLQARTIVHTPVGDLPAELVTFYPSGALRRIFPLNGKLSGFWGWKNEYALSEELEIPTPAGTLRTRFISIQFFESGRIKSLTLWPGEVVSVNSPAGPLKVRTGLAFHEDGGIRSLEPESPVEVETPIGRILAFDPDPEGVTGDVNSLRFAPDGTLEGLATATDRITVVRRGEKTAFEPTEKDSLCGGLLKLMQPLAIGFEAGEAVIDGCRFPLAECDFSVEMGVFEAIRADYACD